MAHLVLWSVSLFQRLIAPYALKSYRLVPVDHDILPSTRRGDEVGLRDCFGRGEAIICDTTQDLQGLLHISILHPLS